MAALCIGPGLHFADANDSELPQSVKESGNVFGVLVGHTHVRHRRLGFHGMRLADPALHVLGSIRQLSRKKCSSGDAVQRWTGFAARAGNIRDGVASIASVVPDQVTSSFGIATG